MLSSRQLARLQHVACAVVFAFVAGCSSGPRSSVEGNVNYDGELVDQGGIVFIPVVEDSGLVRATGPIQNGRYHLDNQRGPNPGKYRVEITWRKKTGNKVPGEGGNPRDEVVMPVPAKYNTESELTVDVQPGRNTFHFDLKK